MFIAWQEDKKYADVILAHLLIIEIFLIVLGQKVLAGFP